MADLSALLKRVKESKGPDRELDRDIAAAFGKPHGPYEFVSGRSFVSTPEQSSAYTASLDASLALVEEILPQRNSEILREAISAESKRHNRHMCFAPLNVSELARDVIAALLRALQSESAKVNEDQKR